MHALSLFSSLDLRDALVFVLSGALGTYLIYKKYEIQPSSYLITLSLLAVTPFFCSSFLVSHFKTTTLAYAIGFSLFYASLLSNIIIYRLSPWHPLAKYPGPLLAKVSKYWIIRVVRRGELHRTIMDLHRIYGPYVRTGPNELSIVDADNLSALLAPDMPRGPIWDGRVNPDAPASLISSRSSKEHAKKRVPWNHAFSSASIREYQVTITVRVRQLVGELKKRADRGEALNIVPWLSYFAFDFMGDMAFGGAFEFMSDGDKEGIIGLMMERIDSSAWQQHIPWATRLLLRLPFVTNKIIKFRRFTIQCAKQRHTRGSQYKDLFYYLSNEGSDDPSKFNLTEAVANGELAIIAGSDTTSTTLSGVFYYLLTNPKCYNRLQAELDSVFPLNEGEPDPSKFPQLTYLNAVINETLRLQPPLPTTLHRAPEKGSGGKWIGKHFFNEGTAINVPPYVLHRDERYFSPSTDSFWPDRWLVPELRDFSVLGKENNDLPVITNTSAFIPFSIGHANCAGKRLALAEMRTVIAFLLHHFDMCLAEGININMSLGLVLNTSFMHKQNYQP
ncbi:cytochrome P450 [Pyrrhoderma noxium]|uniref:Cytochrome P450 n=1 Tax=Pyrrhoderma noxium TaxID=2282107 RepID=A0A286UHT8_9AGAM|nr:cytochrome P450 [Pyrrhoderma noxium]